MPTIDSALGNIDQALEKVKGKDPKSLSSNSMALPSKVDCVLADAVEAALEIEEEHGVVPERRQAVEGSKRFVKRVRAAGDCC